MTPMEPYSSGPKHEQETEMMKPTLTKTEEVYTISLEDLAKWLQINRPHKTSIGVSIGADGNSIILTVRSTS